MRWHALIPLFALAVLPPPTQADTLGRVNIQLYGNIIDWTCVAVADDVTKSVPLGRWTTKQLLHKSDTTPPVHFQLRLTGCPTGPVSIAFRGISDPSDEGLLALNSGSSAKNVAVQFMDQYKKNLPFKQTSQTVQADENGNAVFNFYARYIAVADYPKPGTADADALFLINYD